MYSMKDTLNIVLGYEFHKVADFIELVIELCKIKCTQKRKSKSEQKK